MEKDVIKFDIDELNETKINQYFPNKRSYTMFDIIKNYANNELMYNDAEQKLKKLNYTFSQVKGYGVIKIVVTDKEHNQKYYFKA